MYWGRAAILNRVIRGAVLQTVQQGPDGGETTQAAKQKESSLMSGLRVCGLAMEKPREQKKKKI